LTPFECKYQIISPTFSVFVDASEDLVMVDDVAMLSNPPVAPIKEEEFKETLFNVNVFQWSCKEKPSKGMVRI
jgi:hypothetical protein